jgi:hypothetical protein
VKDLYRAAAGEQRVTFGQAKPKFPLIRPQLTSKS